MINSEKINPIYIANYYLSKYHLHEEDRRRNLRKNLKKALARIEDTKTGKEFILKERQ